MINKTISVTFLILVIAVLFTQSPQQAFAQEPLRLLGVKVYCDPTLPPAQKAGEGKLGGCGVEQFIQLITGLIVKALQWVAIPLAVIFIVYGAFVIMTSAGSPEKVSSGKKIITAAVVGLVIAITAALLIQLIFTILGAKPPELKPFPLKEGQQQQPQPKIEAPGPGLPTPPPQQPIPGPPQEEEFAV